MKKSEKATKKKIIVCNKNTNFFLKKILNFKIKNIMKEKKKKTKVNLILSHVNHPFFYIGSSTHSLYHFIF
jgi:hypothetical protein